MITKIAINLAVLAVGTGLTLGAAGAAGRSPNDGGMTDSRSMQGAPSRGPSGDMDGQSGGMDGGPSMYARPSGLYDARPEGAAPAPSAASACEARFRSYDPASETYLGYDGMRHPCP